jgi:rubrerythrin
MSRIVILDTVGDCVGLAEALSAAGLEASTLTELDALGGCDAEAVVLATDAAGLAVAGGVLDALREKHTPVVLVTSLDRSGWDRTFAAPEGLGVSALFDKPVDARALAVRLKGILAAREEAASAAASPEMASLFERAIANEEAAEAFYRRAAQSVSKPETREALEMLMRDEAEHKRLLEEFKTGARPLPESAPPSGSIVEAFGTPEFTPDMSPADAFLLAANKERLAVEMYENWAKLYPEGPERELLERFADVERAHKARVEAIFTNTAFPEEW